MRAPLFEFDAPLFRDSAEWLAYAAINELRLSEAQQAQPYRFAGSAPAAYVRTWSPPVPPRRFLCSCP